ncbi:MAG: PorT family protein [Prevotella sp.]|nr:PorT family protein [Prevotella sp.]
MKKLLLLVALMALTLSAQAQHEQGDVTIQPRVGFTISNITDGDKSKMNLAYGVDFERFFTDQFSVSLGLMFTNQGCKYDIYYDITFDGSTNGSSSNTTTKLNVYYGSLPIMANYYVLPGLAIKAGVQPAFRVKAKIERGDTKLDLDNMIDMLFAGEGNKLNTFDLSIPVGLSYEIIGITADVRYNFGVTKLISNTDKGIYNKVFTVTLGYKF